MKKRIYLSPPHMSGDERELLLDAYDSNWIAPLGPHVSAFEAEFAALHGMSAAAALSSGTAALHLSLLLCGVGPGDCVITSSLTFAATANAITYVGAEPVFVDSDERSWNMDPQLLAEAIESEHHAGHRVAAVMPVDLYGQSADYDRIVPLCDQHSLPIIEDAAEALGAVYQGRRAGTFGRLGCFSFNGNKIITTSGGGMMIGSEPELIERARFLATQARDPAPHYQHSTIGYNYRMSNLLAAVGRGQLRHLEERVERRRAIFEFYRHALGDLPGIEFMPEISGGRSTRWLTCITIAAEQFGADREQVRLALEAENIEARPLWMPMLLQPVFAERRMYGGRVCERLFRDGLCLPSGSSMTEDDLARVVTVVRAAAKSGAGGTT